MYNWDWALIAVIAGFVFLGILLAIKYL